VVVEWYDRAGKKLHTGMNMDVTPTDTTSLLYTVQAKMSAAPDTDRSAWVRSNVYVRVVPPKAPTGLVNAPSYMEYNLVSAQTYPIIAKLNLAMGLDQEMYPIRGEWHLPDGSVVEGTELDYSPTAQDAEKHQALLEYVAWIEGFKEQTQATLRRSVVVGTYAWPEFQVDVKTNPAVAPALVTLNVAPKTGSLSSLEKPTYTWRLPASAQIVREQDQGRVLQVNFPEVGSFEVGVTITDARGSTAQAMADVALSAPDPFKVEFMPLFSNSLHRELLDVTLRTNVTGGHPQDRLNDYLFTVDSPEAQVTSYCGSGIIKGLRAGKFVAHLKAVSKLGKVVEMDYPISVIANQLPTCQVSSWEAGDYRWYKASCQDPDGRVSALRWYQDDKLISSGQAIRAKKSEITGTLRFEAIDDAGGVYREMLVAPAG
jgi:large repetitive protein